MQTTDYCTLWPDRWITYDYSACCAKHDEDYLNPNVGRLQADNDLFKCVRKNCGVGMATTMWVGVRCFGWAFKTWVPPTKGDSNGTD